MTRRDLCVGPVGARRADADPAKPWWTEKLTTMNARARTLGDFIESIETGVRRSFEQRTRSVPRSDFIRAFLTFDASKNAYKQIVFEEPKIARRALADGVYRRLDAAGFVVGGVVALSDEDGDDDGPLDEDGSRGGSPRMTPNAARLSRLDETPPLTPTAGEDETFYESDSYRGESPPRASPPYESPIGGGLDEPPRTPTRGEAYESFGGSDTAGASPPFSAIGDRPRGPDGRPLARSRPRGASPEREDETALRSSVAGSARDPAADDALREWARGVPSAFDLLVRLATRTEGARPDARPDRFEGGSTQRGARRALAAVGPRVAVDARGAGALALARALSAILLPRPAARPGR